MSSRITLGALGKFIIYLTSKSQNQFYTLPQVTEVITADGQNIEKLHLQCCIAAEYSNQWQKNGARNSKSKELENRGLQTKTQGDACATAEKAALGSGGW